MFVWEQSILVLHRPTSFHIIELERGHCLIRNVHGKLRIFRQSFDSKVHKQVIVKKNKNDSENAKFSAIRSGEIKRKSWNERLKRKAQRKREREILQSMLICKMERRMKRLEHIRWIENERNATKIATPGRHRGCRTDKSEILFFTLKGKISI